MIAATRQHIGLLVLAVMDSETRDVESVLSNFKRCLNTYELWVESYVSFSALDVDQVFKVGDEAALVAPINRSILPSSAVAACTQDGTLTLVHMFHGFPICTPRQHASGVANHRLP
ncbi:hypothetical protein ABWL43_11505 [Pseudomonas sp. HT11]|uniref:hypothetical protein n=1 Tax=Pseudomonas sp. HT11 TaxID=3230490 RepID=UPI00384FCF2C